MATQHVDVDLGCAKVHTQCRHVADFVDDAGHMQQGFGRDADTTHKKGDPQVALTGTELPSGSVLFACGETQSSQQGYTHKRQGAGLRYVVGHHDTVAHLEVVLAQDV